MSHRRWIPTLLLFGAGGFALAGEPDVVVYTNEDLDRLEPIATQSAPIVDNDLGWEFVNEVIERGYRRLDADRSHDLERRQAEAELEEAERRNRREVYGLALAPYGYWGYGRPGHHPDRPGRPDTGHGNRPGPGFANRPVPLHARPNIAQTRMRIDGSRSGAAAVPGATRGSRGSRGSR